MWSIIIHGGVSDFVPSEAEDEMISGFMNAALALGEKLLKKGVDCVTVVRRVLEFIENTGEFNAGRGSVKNRDGIIEMDAAIMRGRDLSWGAVGAVRKANNPIAMAEEIMTETGGLFLVGRGAEKFHEQKVYKNKRYGSIYSDLGTIGCVVLDMNGDLCAGMSSGGAFNKYSSRIGDASIIGAGLYANNETCAISSSGIGEEFIKHSIANTMHCFMKYMHMNLKTACEKVINLLPQEGGGLIAVDRKGNMVVAHNCVKFYAVHKRSEFK